MQCTNYILILFILFLWIFVRILISYILILIQGGMWLLLLLWISVCTPICSLTLCSIFIWLYHVLRCWNPRGTSHMIPNSLPSIPLYSHPQTWKRNPCQISGLSLYSPRRVPWFLSLCLSTTLPRTSLPPWYRCWSRPTVLWRYPYMMIKALIAP